MKWRYETNGSKAKKGWVKWFAWYPLSFNGNTYWLCYVERAWVRNVFDYEYRYKELGKL